MKGKRNGLRITKHKHLPAFPPCTTENTEKHTHAYSKKKEEKKERKKNKKYRPNYFRLSFIWTYNSLIYFTLVKLLTRTDFFIHSFSLSPSLPSSIYLHDCFHFSHPLTRSPARPVIFDAFLFFYHSHVCVLLCALFYLFSRLSCSRHFLV